MKTQTRRHRSSDKPIGKHRIIAPHEIDARYIDVLRRLEPRHPDNIHIFTNPWQRVGHPDFYLSTFDEKGAT